MLPPRVGGTYLDAFTWVYISTYQGAFTIHNVANILQTASGRFQNSNLWIYYVPYVRVLVTLQGFF